ncbi:uncharacterized protein LOC144179759 [Haemaphysalis longicornis]
MFLGVLVRVPKSRWQEYLEDNDLYPDSMIGFRNKLTTQDAMLQLKAEILDDETRTKDNKAILGLDLQSAFDKLKHSAILAQVCALNMGARTYDYVRDFLTGRTTKIQAGGSDGHIESTLQQAVDTIEDQLKGTGLICSPSKSELLVVPPRWKLKTSEDNTVNNRIVVRTGNGQEIPEVRKIRVLGFQIEKNRTNGETVHRLLTKVTAATRLIKRVANKKAGMREDSLIRLIQSFSVSHITYVASYHNWKAAESNRLNAAIRKAYRAALGLPDSASTEKLMDLGVHNTLEEISEAQRAAQMERLKGSKTGRAILAIGLEPGTSGRPLNRQEDIPANIRSGTRVQPLPRNMDPIHNGERRKARAKAMIEQHANAPGTRYVDAAEYRNREAFTAVVIDAVTGETVSVTSVKICEAQSAEEVAIALAIADPNTKTVLCDSKGAVRNFAKARSAEAETETVIPPWLQDAARSYNKEDQLLAVQQILEALQRQRPSESCEASATPRARWLNRFVRHFEPLSYEPLRVHRAHVRVRRYLSHHQHQQPGHVYLRFQGFRRLFHLKLKPDTSAFHKDLVVETERHGRVKSDIGHIYRGQLVGDRSSHVYGALVGGLFEGSIRTSSGLYYVERALRFFARVQPFHSVLYDARDAHFPSKGGWCGVRGETERWMNDVMKARSALTRPRRATARGTTSTGRRSHARVPSGSKERRAGRKLLWGATGESAPCTPDTPGGLVDETEGVNVSARQAGFTFSQRVCNLKVSVDHLLYAKMAEGDGHPLRTRERITAHIAAHVARASEIFRRTKFGRIMDISFVVQKIMINDSRSCSKGVRSSNPFCSSAMDASYMLHLTSKENHDDFCLAYTFTYRDFADGVLGLAWTAAPTPSQGGICEKYKVALDIAPGTSNYKRFYLSLNTGILTFQNYKHFVPRVVSEITFTHELGHNFGSSHDAPPGYTCFADCAPCGPGGNYIMYPSATTGLLPNNDKFSPCSLRNITAVVKSMFDGTSTRENCFQDDVPALESCRFARFQINDSRSCSKGVRSSNPFCSSAMDASYMLHLTSKENHDDFCLAYTFTYRDFADGVLGLAWTAAPTPSQGGICEKYKVALDIAPGTSNYKRFYLSLNTGILTFQNYKHFVPRVVSEITFTHELGHNFGSSHDAPPGYTCFADCAPCGPGGNYIMYPSATTGLLPNNDKFSPCSLRNITAVVKSMFDGTSTRENCFQADSGPICGNAILERNEECDCGAYYCAENCCYPRHNNWSAPGCTLRKGAECSPSSGPCCAPTCKLLDSSAICNDGTVCREASACDGLTANCPEGAARANMTPCNENTQVCINGECSASICIKYGLQGCTLPRSSYSADDACLLACMNSSKRCRPACEFASMKTHCGAKLTPGAPCNGLRGYCDVFRKCRDVDDEGALTRLRRVLFAEKSYGKIMQFIKVHPVMSTLLALSCVWLMALAFRCLAVHTPSNNPNKLHARELRETLKRPWKIVS